MWVLELCKEGRGGSGIKSGEEWRLKRGVYESGVWGCFLPFSEGRGIFSCVCFSLPD